MDYCQAGGSSVGASWCPDKWCYTNSWCEDSVAGTYFTAQEGPQLYYNYRICGAQDTYTAP